MPKVFIVGNVWNKAFEEMFKTYGWELSSYEDAEFIQFTGGEDVNPALYNDKVHPTTMFNSYRDEREIEWFKRATAQGKNLLGVCRGGQLLNVLNGGSMYQHVNNHTRCHPVFVNFDGEKPREVVVTSTHHQMMIPNHYTGRVIGYAFNQATERYTGSRFVIGAGWDTEIVWYEETKCFCFQPHPEFGMESCANLYFELIARLF